VFAFRQGRNARVIPFQRYTGDNTMIVADHVAEAILRYNVDKVFIDGVGVGGGVVDRLVQMGYSNVIITVLSSPKRATSTPISNGSLLLYSLSNTLA
jgi:alpha-beta hydrolase superfamily lysophospholipase